MTKLGAYSGRAQFSPDGKKFVIVVKKGNLHENTNQYSLLLWLSAGVFSSPPPTLLLTMSSSSNRPAISAVSWLADSQTIAFLGEHPGELQQLYTFDIRTKLLRKFTNHPTNLHSYGVTPDGMKVAFSADAPYRRLFDRRAQRLGAVISSQALSDLIRGREGGPNYDHDQLFFQLTGGAAKNLVPPSRESEFGTAPSLSPNGRFVAIAVDVVNVPDQWNGYSEPSLRKVINLTVEQKKFQGLQTYILIDTKTGTSRTLLASPLNPSRVSGAAWSPDSHSVVLTNVYLPLVNTTDQEREIRKAQSFTVELSVLTGEIGRISEENLYGVEWDSTGGRLTAHTIQQQSNTFYGLGPTVSFRKNGANWERVRRETSDLAPDITVEQDLYTPPRLVALDAKTQRKKIVWDFNPQLNDLRFGRVEETHWNASDGHVVSGGLYYPVDFVPGNKYPLVIQTHGWNPHQFWIDGPYTTAFAAQELAGKNLIVLQTELSTEDLDSPREAPREVAAYEGAIEYLDKRGLIDRDRVGIIGYSRTCFHVKYALTDPQFKFAAASITDGVDAGYFQYMIESTSNPSIPNEFEEIYGATPFGLGSQLWMAQSPGFHVDRVHTPIRITALSPDSALFEWEWFSSLTRLRKPVEMIMIQDGSHVLEKPWDRMISQQGNVDWFCFWLKGEEDPDPTKAEQYTRWRELRKLQNENDKAAKGKSAAHVN